MEQIKAHIAVSLDGHTATPDYELDWLPDKVKAIIGKYYLDADCLLMGANTYNYIFEHWGGWPHKSKRSFCGVTLRHQRDAGLRRGVPDRRTAAKGL